MYELTSNEYEKAMPLFQGMEIHLAVKAALAGLVPAKLYVDDPNAPHSALAGIQSRFYLTGAEDTPTFHADLRRFFLESIYPEALAAGKEMFVLHYAPDPWANVIEKILEGKYPIPDRRQYYRFKEFKQNWRTLLPAGFTLRVVDRTLLETGQLQNLDGLRHEMCSERPSVEEFLAQSFGVCIVHGEALAGWCLSEYNTSDSCEIGIETLEPYQKRGLATAMTSAFVEHARARGITQIGWHCYASNIPSVATALKAGFEHVADYPAYMAWFDEVENLGINGNILFRNGEYVRALEWYEKVFARGNAPVWVCWSAACASARLGKTDAALGYLGQAIDQGFNNLERLQTSPHLESLRAMDGWNALISRVAQTLHA